MRPRSYARLTTPLIRDHGRHSPLRPATWDEALDRAAKGLHAVVAAHGPKAFGMFSCSKTTNDLYDRLGAFGSVDAAEKQFHSRLPTRAI